MQCAVLERRDQEDNCMQAEPQGRSATLSSNTHSGWASSHYSPPGAKLHLPHILKTPQSPSFTLTIAQTAPAHRLRCCKNTQGGG